MRTRTLALAVAIATLASPAFAQLTSGPGSSNSMNQSFNSQNEFRNLQQNQTMQNNQIRSQLRNDQLYNGPTSTGTVGPRIRGGRH